jgi:hypothetical protein
VKVVIAALAAFVVVALAATVAVAAPSRLTRARYVAMLRAANTASAKVDDAAGAALQGKATPARVKALLVAMGKEHIAIGKEFARLVPPKAAAKANADFAHAELVFGRQNEAIAARLPTTRTAMLRYFHALKPPSGGKLLDRAIAELHAAGYRI